jgi:YVTN family beta-propeller protein
VYVADSHSDTVTVIDGARNRVVKTINSGKNPYAVAVDPNSGHIYVLSYGHPALTIVDPN